LHPDLFRPSVYPSPSIVDQTPTENPGTFRILLNLGNVIPELLISILPLDALALLVIAGVASYFKEGAALAMNRIISRLA
jgi:hypothetical protein